MQIRKATLADVDELVKLQDGLVKFHEKLRGSYAWEQTTQGRKKVWRKWAEKVIRSPKMTIMVAVEDGKIVGYMLGAFTKRPPIFKVNKSGVISDVFVAEKYRKKGTGRAIVKEMLKWFKSQGVDYVETSADTRNPLAKKAWHSYGFKDFRIRMMRKI